MQKSGRRHPDLGPERGRFGDSRGGALPRSSLSLYRPHPRRLEGRCGTSPGDSASWHRSRTPTDVGHRCNSPGPRTPLPRRVFEGSRRTRSTALQRPPHHQVLRGASRSPLARRFVVGSTQRGGRAGRLENEDGWHRGCKPWSSCSSRRDRRGGEKGERREREEERKKEEKEKEEERPVVPVQRRGMKEGKGQEKKEGYGEKPCQLIQLNEQFIHRRVQGSDAGGVVPGVRDGPTRPDQEEATSSSPTLSSAIAAQKGGEQIGVLGRRGRVGPEGRSSFWRASANQRDRLAVPGRSQCPSNRTDARVAGSGVGAGSTTRWSLERNITQILQTNALPQNVRTDVQGSPDAFNNRRSIIEGHGAGGTRHPDPAIEVVGSAGLRTCVDILPADGIIASRRSQPFVEARTIDCSRRASCGSEGPSSRKLEGLEQRQGRKSRKGRWRQGKRKKGKSKAKEGLEGGSRQRSHDLMNQAETGRECPDSGSLQPVQRATSDAQGRDIDSTATALRDRG